MLTYEIVRALGKLRPGSLGNMQPPDVRKHLVVLEREKLIEFREPELGDPKAPKHGGWHYTAKGKLAVEKF